MAARFANSYVDRLFSERDLGAIYHLIGVREMQRPWPEEFWIFCRIYEWAPARSGVRQYYESLPDEAFMRMSQALERFGLTEIVAKYRLEGTHGTGQTELRLWTNGWIHTHSRFMTLPFL